MGRWLTFHNSGDEYKFGFGVQSSEDIVNLAMYTEGAIIKIQPNADEWEKRIDEEDDDELKQRMIQDRVRLRDYAGTDDDDYSLNYTSLLELVRGRNYWINGDGADSITNFIWTVEFPKTPETIDDLREQLRSSWEENEWNKHIQIPDALLNNDGTSKEPKDYDDFMDNLFDQWLVAGGVVNNSTAWSDYLLCAVIYQLSYRMHQAEEELSIGWEW